MDILVEGALLLEDFPGRGRFIVERDVRAQGRYVVDLLVRACRCDDLASGQLRELYHNATETQSEENFLKRCTCIENSRSDSSRCSRDEYNVPLS